MSHPIQHAKSSAKKFGGQWEDYIKYHEWFDETKGWVGHSIHRMFRHHSEGIFELEKKFGTHFFNSDNKIVYTRYVGEQHVKEDCNGYIPSAKEWVNALNNKETPTWMLKTQKLED
jgi:predicted peptidase